MTNLQQQPISLTLPPERVFQTLDFVRQLRDNKSANGVADMKFDATNTQEGVNILGHLGEQVVSQILDIPIDLDIYEVKDTGIDTTYKGHSAQVKTSTLPKLIFNYPSHFKTDIAILVQYVGANKSKSHEDPQFRLWGWIDKQTFMDTHYTQNFGYGDRLVLDAVALKPMSFL